MNFRWFLLVFPVLEALLLLFGCLHEWRNGPWLSVPQFGDWDQKGQMPDYSLDFSKIREMRKQNKKDASRASLGNEDDFINPTANMPKSEPRNDHQSYPQRHHQSPNPRRSVFSCFNCCVRA
ncbi:hypothetical protein K2173_005289 [Erythroxylum novogranatense]|uniref:RIN4 pathogenic type III effector avirulence factor Avr cleavage site domain-containing protein n=1 Tax=Erythroxylum novogranatense TaxID=1862640 RepID=A0AAV8TRX3_9ROSI|nr:hypothetical protein K2173_005289 [Erythroxylum novogranatense]